MKIKPFKSIKGKYYLSYNPIIEIKLTSEAKFNKIMQSYNVNRDFFNEYQELRHLAKRNVNSYKDLIIATKSSIIKSLNLKLLPFVDSHNLLSHSDGLKIKSLFALTGTKFESMIHIEPILYEPIVSYVYHSPMYRLSNLGLKILEYTNKAILGTVQLSDYKYITNYLSYINIIIAFKEILPENHRIYTNESIIYNARKLQEILNLKPVSCETILSRYINYKNNLQTN